MRGAKRREKYDDGVNRIIAARRLEKQRSFGVF